MKMPAVSVTIPCYNGAAFIETAIRSALAQTFDDLEVVVVDDGSDDESGDIVGAIDDSRVRYLRQANRGLAATRNVLVDEARGEFVAFLDQDDWWEPARLERQLPLFADPAVAVVYSDCYVANARGDVLGCWSQRSSLHRGQVFEPLLELNFVPLPTLTMRRSAILEVGPFLPFKIAEEYDILLKCAARYRFDFVAAPLATYRLHDGQHSRKYETALSELLTIYGTWRDVASSTPRLYMPIDAAVAAAYYSAGKNAIYLDGDTKKARRYFRQSLGCDITTFALGFYALSFLGVPIVRRLRRLAVGASGTYSFSE